ncbi:MAG: glycosyltransferase family 4 protein [Anaerolineae bacterium]
MTQKYKISFIIEHALGHITYGQNLQRNVAHDHEIEDFWSFPQQPKSGIQALPGIRNWTLQASTQANRSIKQLVDANNRPDAIFFHTQVTAVLARKWMNEIPSVVSLDATPIQYDSVGEVYEHASGPAMLENLKYNMNKACYDRATHLVTWSEWTRSSLMSDYGVSGDKITVIHPGVNVNEWPGADTETLEEPESDNRPVRILFVGGNLKRKGGEDLVQAFKAAQSELDNCPIELHIVTRDQVEAGENIFVYNNMTVNSPELKNLYKQADIFCMPTYGDFLPMVLSEAAASGLPLISTDIAANRERIQPGENGLLVEPGNIREIKEAIMTLAQNPAERKEMGKNALEHTRRSFDAQANALQLFDLLKSVAGKPS